MSDAAAHNLRPGFGNSDTDIDQSHRFVEEIFRSAMSDELLKSMNGKPVRMAQSDFRMVGLKRLNILGTRANETPYFIDLFDGDNVVNYDVANKQLNVEKVGKAGRMMSLPVNGLDDFRTILRTPNFVPGDVDKVLASAVTKELPNGRVLVSFSGVEVLADPRNGFVERLALPRFDDARVVGTSQEILQFGPKTFPGNVVFPRVRLVCDYQEGKLFMLHVVTNDELRVNEGFSDGDFNLKLPAGTNVVDYRADDFHPDSKRIETEIPDAAAYVKAHVPKVREKRDQRAAWVDRPPAKVLTPVPLATPAMPSK